MVIFSNSKWSTPLVCGFHYRIPKYLSAYEWEMLWTSWFWTLIDYRWWCGSLQIWWKILTGYGINWIPGYNIQSIQWVCILFQFCDTECQLLIIFVPLYRLGHYTIPEEMDEVCAWLTSKLGLGGRSSWFDVVCIYEGFAWARKNWSRKYSEAGTNKLKLPKVIPGLLYM